MTEENAETLRALEALAPAGDGAAAPLSGRISSADGAGLAKAAYLLLEEVDAAKALLSYAGFAHHVGAEGACRGAAAAVGPARRHFGADGAGALRRAAFLPALC